MNQNKFFGKKILFFSVQTFDLEKKIQAKLEELGATVLYFDERPANSIWAKGIIRVKKSWYQCKIDRYYHKVFEHIKNQHFDYLLVNKGEVMPAFFLEKLTQQMPDCIKIFYTWDSFKNNRHPEKIIDLFDRKFSFDAEDAAAYGLNFRPLFFLDDYRKIRNSCTNKKFDLIFLGTAHSDRYRITREVNDWCLSKGLRTYYYYYIPNKIVYYLKRKLDKTFLQFDIKKLSFKSLSASDIVRWYDESNVILDVNHPSQSGLTLRVFEAIGAGKKLITTNQEVIKYSFYNPVNIFIIDRKNIVLNEGFFMNDYQEISMDLYERASLTGWLNCLFFEKESNIWINDRF
ncbi:hypothetical protein QGN23_07170 [Chryseobacterium gotjawalense]|uniref:Lipopolysaccharide biosynthesis protein n=1 Tax=Chryseobacterium gotjawalense TaxID=3042315 RepID=A0ABY8RI42_9FLAO|nr:hypothetical protein [Chryseobacterium sp. wdc7]WHF53043.1 hypothetical protein QGN23_07170 [Chryseobacterium sp. wdc7]